MTRATAVGTGVASFGRNTYECRGVFSAEEFPNVTGIGGVSGLQQ